MYQDPLAFLISLGLSPSPLNLFKPMAQFEMSPSPPPWWEAPHPWDVSAGADEEFRRSVMTPLDSTIHPSQLFADASAHYPPSTTLVESTRAFRHSSPSHNPSNRLSPLPEASQHFFRSNFPTSPNTRSDPHHPIVYPQTPQHHSLEPPESSISTLPPPNLPLLEPFSRQPATSSLPDNPYRPESRTSSLTSLNPVLRQPSPLPSTENGERFSTPPFDGAGPQGSLHRKSGNNSKGRQPVFEDEFPSNSVEAQRDWHEKHVEFWRKRHEVVTSSWKRGDGSTKQEMKKHANERQKQKSGHNRAKAKYQAFLNQYLGNSRTDEYRAAGSMIEGRTVRKEEVAISKLDRRIPGQPNFPIDRNPFSTSQHTSREDHRSGLYSHSIVRHSDSLVPLQPIDSHPLPPTRFDFPSIQDPIGTEHETSKSVSVQSSLPTWVSVAVQAPEPEEGTLEERRDWHEKRLAASRFLGQQAQGNWKGENSREYRNKMTQTTNRYKRWKKRYEDFLRENSSVENGLNATDGFKKADRDYLSRRQAIRNSRQSRAPRSVVQKS